MAKIEINALSPKSIHSAIEQIRKILDFEQKLDWLCRLIAQRACSEAKSLYSEGIGHGNTDVNVTWFQSGNQYIIRASGEDVGFLEFGTGVYAADTLAYGSEFGVGEGTWSIKDKRQYVEKGYWYYNGEKLYGTVNTRAMFYAGKNIDVLGIAREVFHD